MLHMLIIEETLTPLSVFICHLVRGLRVGNSGPSYFLSFSSVKTPSRKWALKGMQADGEDAVHNSVRSGHLTHHSHSSHMKQVSTWLE